MDGSSPRGNRETSVVPCGDHLPLGRSDKATSQTADMHAAEESDGLIVPSKRANNADEAVPRVAAESVEGRGPAKGNEEQSPIDRPQRRNHRSGGLFGVRLAAEKNRKLRFTNLMHHLTLELLHASFFDLKKSAAAGIDDVTWQEYAQAFETRLQDLHTRVHSGRYRAQPSKRQWIPKSDGRLRPLGIAALEDKIVQAAMVTLLTQIYEVDFQGFSYGFRPGKSQHNALDAVSVGLLKRKVNWILDADIQGFFDNISHEWLLKALEVRIGDHRVLALIQKWLTAGVSDEGEWLPTTVGTPQGAVISPLLANVFLHYVLDQWLNNWRRQCRGDVIVVRYADDFVMGFQHRDEAERCLRDHRERLAKYGLTLHPEKTRLLEFGRFATRQRQQRGESPPETFAFLGFTHHCGKTRQGWFKVGRLPLTKRMRTKLGEIKMNLRRRMHERVEETGPWLRSVVRGWLNYYAVPGTSHMLDQFVTEVDRLWAKSLRRRSQRGQRSWPWTRISKLVKHWIPRARIVHPYPDQRLSVT
jgi:group II intron reverse transcriptase/maturase